MSRDERVLTLWYPLGFVARATALSALSSLLGLWILRWAFSRDLGAEYAPAFYLMKHLLSFLLPVLFFCLLAVLLVASTALFVMALFASHKVAGPLFRLQRVAGYLNRRTLVGLIHLRAGDQGKPVAACINQWVTLRKAKSANLRAAAEQVERALRHCEAEQGQRDLEGLRQAVAQLQRSTGRLQDPAVCSESATNP